MKTPYARFGTTLVNCLLFASCFSYSHFLIASDSQFQDSKLQSEIKSNEDFYYRLTQECHSHDHCEHQIIKNSDNTPNPSSPARRAIEAFHFAIDGEHKHFSSIFEFLKSFANKDQLLKIKNEFDFKAILFRTKIAYNIYKQDPELVEHAKNLAFILPFSHLIELSVSPGFVTLGSYFDWAQSVIAFGGATLSIIMIPGLDPVCLLIVSTYPMKSVYKTINYARKTTEDLVDWLYNKLKIKALKEQYRAEINPINLYQDLEFDNADQIDHLPELKLEFQTDPYAAIRIRSKNKRLLQLVFAKSINANNNNSLWLSSLNLHKDLLKDPVLEETILSSLYYLLPKEIHYALKQMIEKLRKNEIDQLENALYVDKIIFPSNDDVFIEFSNEALIWKAYAYWFNRQGSENRAKKRLSKCQNLLGVLK